MPVEGGILISVSHIILWGPSWGALPGEQQEGGHGGVQHVHGECCQFYMWHHYQTTGTTNIHIWGPKVGGQGEGGHGGDQHDHGEHHQYYLSYNYQNASI